MNSNNETQIVKKNNKKKLIISITAIALVILVAFGVVLTINVRSANREKALQEQLDLGNKYLNELDYEQAIVAYEAAIEIDPMSVEAYLGLADTYLNMEDFEKAKEVLQAGYDATGDERIKEKITELEEIISTGIFLIDKDNDGKHDNDVRIITQIIQEQRALGAIADENLDSEQYVWVDGRLTEIEWVNMKLSGEISFAGLGRLERVVCATSYGLSSVCTDENRKEEHCSFITGIDISNNVNLKIFDCTGNNLQTLDISNNHKITNLYCAYNQLSDLDISNNYYLEGITCSYNELTQLCFNSNGLLSYICCYDNRLTKLDISCNKELTWLECDRNNLTDIDVSHNLKLGCLCVGENNLTSLDLSNNTNLGMLYCGYNQLDKLDLSNNNLYTLGCSGNNFITLDLSRQSNLQVLHCCKLNISTLDIRNCPSLIFIECGSDVEIIGDTSNIGEIRLTD